METLDLKGINMTNYMHNIKLHFILYFVNYIFFYLMNEFVSVVFFSSNYDVLPMTRKARHK